MENSTRGIPGNGLSDARRGSLNPMANVGFSSMHMDSTCGGTTPTPRSGNGLVLKIFYSFTLVSEK